MPRHDGGHVGNHEGDVIGRKRRQRRNRSTAVAVASTAASTSVAIVSSPREKRIICRPAALIGFIARMTCEGSSESARQAEPALAQMPA